MQTDKTASASMLQKKEKFKVLTEVLMRTISVTLPHADGYIDAHVTETPVLW